jgi:hypothetical protein
MLLIYYVTEKHMATCKIITRPQDATCVWEKEKEFRLHCSTDLDDPMTWHFISASEGSTSEEIFSGAYVVEHLNARYRVEQNKHRNYTVHTLFLLNVDTHHAGRYICQDDDGLGETSAAELTVLIHPKNDTCPSKPDYVGNRKPAEECSEKMDTDSGTQICICTCTPKNKNVKRSPEHKSEHVCAESAPREFPMKNTILNVSNIPLVQTTDSSGFHTTDEPEINSRWYIAVAVIVPMVILFLVILAAALSKRFKRNKKVQNNAPNTIYKPCTTVEQFSEQERTQSNGVVQMSTQYNKICTINIESNLASQ